MSDARLEAEVRRTLVRFPDHRLREEFLRHVRLWDLVRELPPIAAEPLADGLGVHLAEPCPSTARLAEAFGGRPVRP